MYIVCVQRFMHIEQTDINFISLGWCVYIAVSAWCPQFSDQILQLLLLQLIASTLKMGKPNELCEHSPQIPCVI